MICPRKFSFLASGFFLFTCGILTLIFCFFLIFLSDFLKIGFSIHSEFILGLFFCSVNENSLNCTSGLVLLCFFVSSSDALSCYICSHSKAEKVKFYE